MNMNKYDKYKRIILIGDGWGAVSAFKSLKILPNPIAVLTDDEDILTEKPERIRSLDGLKDELLIFAGYKPIVPLEILENNTCINIHYSLLPAYRGLHSTVWAILNDEPKLGLTVHLMDQYIDNGPIIYQYAVENDFVKTSCEYMELFNRHIEENLYKVIQDFIENKVTPITQDKSKASWVGKRRQIDCRIDFAKPICYQKAFFRALVKPYPLPYFEYKGNEYRVTEVDFHKSDISTHLERILNIDNEGIWIKIQDGYMIIKEIIDSQDKIVDLDRFKIGMFLNK